MLKAAYVPFKLNSNTTQ